MPVDKPWSGLRDSLLDLIEDALSTDPRSKVKYVPTPTTLVITRIQSVACTLCGWSSGFGEHEEIPLTCPACGGNSGKATYGGKANEWQKKRNLRSQQQ